MLKRAKVVMLPTNEVNGDFSKERVYPCILQYGFKDQERLVFAKSNIKTPTIQHHLYIISNDEIKEGDVWFNKDDQSINTGINWSFANNAPSCNKVIATTNESLKLKKYNSFNSCCRNKEECHCSLPQLSQSFVIKYVEKYNAGQPIVDIMVECNQYFGDKLISSKEDYEFYIRHGSYSETNKWKEKLKVDKNNCITIKPVKDSWNREEVERLIRLAMQFRGYTSEYEVRNFVENNL